MALGYLYSYQATSILSQANARSVLACACLLGGMDDLCKRAYQVCKESIRVDTIEDWLVWIDAHRSPFAAHSPSASATSTPRSPSPSSAQHELSSNAVAAASIYGPYAQMIREDVLNFLIMTLPTILFADNESSRSDFTSEAMEALLRIFSRVSFDSQWRS
jgi:hypothetical protein